MYKNCDVLILDDNKIIAKCILSRMLKANESFKDITQININPTHLHIDTNNIKNTIRLIESNILDNCPQFLLVDRGLFEIFDPSLKDIEGLDKGSLYIKTGWKNIKITEILKEINFSRFKNFKGLILYTYDEPSLTSEWYVDPVSIKRELKSIVGEKIDIENIDIVLTNSEIYNLANLTLYDKNSKQIGEYLELGKKSNFMLYGLFMGEILYHRLIKILEKQKSKTLLRKKGLLKSKIFILFIIFTSLSIGGSALYSILYEKIKSPEGLLFLSLVFSILFPFLLLILRPELVISIDDDD